MKNKIFKDNKLPFVELRYAEYVEGCDKKHIHDMLTITAIESGEIELIFNDETVNLKKNILSVINPNVPHSAILINDDSKGGYVLYLDEKWCIGIQNFFMKTNNCLIPVSSHSIYDPVLYCEFISLCRLLFSKTFLLEKEEKLIEYITKLFLNHCNVNQFIETSDKNNEVLSKIKDFLDKNYLNDITLNDIAQYSGYNPYYLIRIFQKEYGLSPHAYIINKKIHKAKDLLAEKIPIVDVAVTCGFFDQSHFHRYFKRIFSITPNVYQKNLCR